MVPELLAALNATQTATKMATSLLKASSDVKINDIAIQLQQTILDLQSKLLEIQVKYEELAESKRQAEKKLIEQEKWDAIAARYQLQELAPGIFVYALKAVEPPTEPSHYTCPRCFERKKRSILQKPTVESTQYKCPECQWETVPTPAPLPPKIVFNIPGLPRRRLSR